MSITDRIGAINAARRDNITQHHTVNTPREHAGEIVVILLGAVAELAEAAS